MNGPATCLYRVSLGLSRDDDRPMMPTGACQSVTVVAKDAEVAVARARERLYGDARDGGRTCVVSVEFLEGIDVP